MKALFLFLASFVSTIQAIDVETNGWVLKWKVTGTVATNSAFSWGWGSSNAISGNQSLTLYHTTMGYRWNGSAPVQTTYLMKNLGGKQLRFPYPTSQASTPVNDVRADGSDVDIRSSLIEYVCKYDSNLTVSIAANTYGSMSSISSSSLTNNSIVEYPAPFGNWAWPGRRLITNNMLTLKFLAFHYSASQGRPFCAAAAVVSDTHGGVVTNWQTSMGIDRTIPDAVPAAEITFPVDVSSLHNNDALRCDVYVYPWLGTNVFFTGDGKYSAPPNYCSQTNFLDRLGTYGPVIALVTTGGNDTTGTAVAYGGNPSPFATINQAAVAIKGTNSMLYGHADVGGGIIYLGAGSFDASSGGAYGAAAQAELTICGTNGASFLYQGDGAIGYYTKWRGINFTNNATLGQWTGGGQCVFESCGFNTTSAALWYIDGGIPFHMIDCQVTNLSGQGLHGYSTKNTPFALVRGNNFNYDGVDMATFCTFGNYFRNGDVLIYDTRGLGEVDCVPAIVFNNYIANAKTSAGVINMSAANLLGAAVVQNVIECTNSGSAPILTLWADGITTAAIQVLEWHNTTIGQRRNGNYNSSGSSAVNRQWWSVKGNLYDDYNIKADIFTGAGGADGGRVGNWAAMWGVGYRNNYFKSSTIGAGFLNSSDAENFGFDGINSITGSAVTSPLFVNRQACGASGTGSGGGDYRIKTESPLTKFPDGFFAIPFDIEGNNRSVGDPPGAFASANVKRL